MFGSVANGILPGRKCIVNVNVKSKVSISGFR